MWALSNKTEVMTQVSLGDCQHVRFSATFFSHDFEIISNYYEYLLIELLYGLSWLVFSSSHIQLYVPCPGLFPQMPSSPPVQGKARRQTNNDEITLGFLMFCTDVFLISLLIYQLVYFFPSSQARNHSLFLFLSWPFFPSVSFLACFFPLWLVASASPIAT